MVDMTAEERARKIYGRGGIRRQPGTVYAVTRAIRAAERAAYEQAMKAVCMRCAGDWPINKEYWHTAPKKGGHVLLPEGLCQAIGIRKLAGFISS